jgi:hypothetical protein
LIAMNKTTDAANSVGTNKASLVRRRRAICVGFQN